MVRIITEQLFCKKLLSPPYVVLASELRRNLMGSPGLPVGRPTSDQADQKTGLAVHFRSEWIELG